MGNLSEGKLIEAILDAPIIYKYKYAWTITDTIDGRGESPSYVYGELSKFATEGAVTVVDTESKSKVDELAENLHIASAPFVYLPDFSGIAYLHVWNQIQEEVFPRRFSEIVEEAYDGFFVRCIVEPVSDYTTFIVKIKELEIITEISATVHPPNPLFGKLWESLQRYIRERNAEQVYVRETTTKQGGLNTRIPQVMGSEGKAVVDEPLSLTDAALLMAADGYGRGSVQGYRRGKIVVIRTTEAKKSFLFAKSPEPRELAQRAWEEFNEISKQRGMAH